MDHSGNQLGLIILISNRFKLYIKKYKVFSANFANLFLAAKTAAPYSIEIPKRMNSLYKH